MIILGICGASGSGKSTLAKRVRDSLGCSCTIIGQDCYYRNHPELTFEERTHLNYDEPAIFDFDDMYADILALGRGESVPKKGYDYAQHLRADSDEMIDPPEVLILEGIHMFYDRRLTEEMDLKVYMQVDADVCVLRRLKRDVKTRGRSIESVTEQYLTTVKPMFEKYVVNYAKDADISVMRGGKNAAAVSAITAYIRECLLKAREGKKDLPG